MFSGPCSIELIQGQNSENTCLAIDLGCILEAKFEKVKFLLEIYKFNYVRI